MVVVMVPGGPCSAGGRVRSNLCFFLTKHVIQSLELSLLQSSSCLFL